MLAIQEELSCPDVTRFDNYKLAQIWAMSTVGTTEFMLGQYKVGKCIGQGTFGKVRLAIHVPTDQKVAVKTLQKQKIVEQADIERVTREICILKILRHPNIIQLYEIIETKTDIHLIMEYADGGELFDYIVKKKRLDDAEAVFFMQQIISGVEYIHKNGIVHRDLKPENLLLDRNKQIKIVDFGLSNQYKPGEKLKTACGSPCYAAPEMIAGKRYQCLNVDIWSCGIILYAMLCGYLPFEDPNTNKLYKKIMAGDFELPKILSADSKDMLKNILNVNPQTRFKIAQIRQSRWYCQTGHKYINNGIVVGKDTIEPNERIVQRMEKIGIDPAQIRNYVANNRHNHITAHYYLMKNKLEKDPAFLQEEMRASNSQNKRSQSPLIFRPETKKDYYLPQKKSGIRENRDNSRNNDSFNAMEANKGKLANTSQASKLIKKQDNFDKMQEFKLFPKKKTSSIYDQNTSSNSKSGMTSRSGVEDKSFDFSLDRPSFKVIDRPSLSGIERPVSSHIQTEQTYISTEQSDFRDDDPNVNKKRQELSDQLKQISLKIDKEIYQLRKQNNIGVSITPSSTAKKPRDSMGPAVQVCNNRLKTDSPYTHMHTYSKQPNQSPRDPNQSFGFMGKDKTRQSQINRHPRIHMGPFNSQCLFLQNPRNLTLRTASYLHSQNIPFQQLDLYLLQLSEHDHISIQSLQGMLDYCLVKFTASMPWHEGLISYLNQVK